MKGTTMRINHRRGLRRLSAIAAVAAVASALLVGCGGEGGNDGGGAAPPKAHPEALDAALEKGGTITWWTWTDAEKHEKAFEKQYPNVDVKVVNVGTGTDHYTKLQNALKAGEGAPDLAQVEYHALAQFGQPGYLVDLREYGLDSLEADFTPSDWEAAHLSDALYGLPQGGGPMVMFYNKRIFDEHSLTVPTTWDEFMEEADKLKQADPSKYFTADPGEAGEDMALIWQAGGRPFKVDGSEITIDFGDEGTQQWVENWNELLGEDNLAPFPHWSEEWFKALQDGTVATLPFGGWQAGVFAGLKDGVGDWRVAPLPTYDGGDPVSAHHGGSNHSVMEQSDNPDLAAAFLRWLTAEEGASVYAELGGFPATVEELNDPEFLNYEWPYFGGQQVNQIIVDAANSVGEGWQFLPYQTYANTIWGDNVGKSFLKKADIAEGLEAWEEALVEHGEQQGFETSGG